MNSWNINDNEFIHTHNNAHINKIYRPFILCTPFYSVAIIATIEIEY